MDAGGCACRAWGGSCAPRPSRRGLAPACGSSPSDPCAPARAPLSAAARPNTGCTRPLCKVALANEGWCWRRDETCPVSAGGGWAALEQDALRLLVEPRVAESEREVSALLVQPRQQPPDLRPAKESSLFADESLSAKGRWTRWVACLVLCHVVVPCLDTVLRELRQKAVHRRDVVVRTKPAPRPARRRPLSRAPQAARQPTRGRKRGRSRAQEGERQGGGGGRVERVKWLREMAWGRTRDTRRTPARGRARRRSGLPGKCPGTLAWPGSGRRARSRAAGARRARIPAPPAGGAACRRRARRGGSGRSPL